MLRKLTNKKGFTLIELMIVIAIIGILAAIAIPNFISYRNKAYCSRAESDAQNTLAALSSYFSEANNFTCTTAARLTAQEDLTINSGNTVQLLEDTTVTPVSYTVYATDGSNRCPRGSYYISVMGADAQGRWSTG